MTTFDERERGEETKFKHDLELGFKIRNRRNKLFGLWVAQDHLGLTGDAAVSYAKDVVMADFELPGRRRHDRQGQGRSGQGRQVASATMRSTSSCRRWRPRRASR